MVNQSLVSVPPNVDDPLVLQRFLSRLVEQLDIVLGNRAGPTNQYVSQEELLAQANTLTSLLQDAQSSLEQALLRLDDTDELIVEELTKRITAAEQKNVEQDGRLDDIDTLNTTQNGRLDGMDTLNTTQNGRLTSLETAGYITDAPSDGNIYGRKDGAWVVIV